MTTIHCFTIPALNPEPAQTQLNTFLGRERVLALRREFIADGANSQWVFCVLRKGQRKGPVVLVGRGLEALLRTLPGCSVRAVGVLTHVD